MNEQIKKEAEELVSLFELNAGDRFRTGSGKEFTIKSFKTTRRPRVGRVLQCNCFDETDKKDAAFIINHTVTKIHPTKTIHNR